MRMHPPSSIYRYLDVPSTQKSRLTTRTYITPPHPYRPWSYPTTHSLPTPPHPTPPHPTATQTQTHVQHSPFSYGISKPQTQSSYPPTTLNIHISHTSPTSFIPCPTLIHITSAALDTQLIHNTTKRHSTCNT